jgi:hypothetical protein
MLNKNDYTPLKKSFDNMNMNIFNCLIINVILKKKIGFKYGNLILYYILLIVKNKTKKKKKTIVNKFNE